MPAAARIGFVQDYTITEGINSSVSVEIQVLEGGLGRSVEVAVFTVNDSAAGIKNMHRECCLKVSF
jgi:hypothetical protein